MWKNSGLKIYLIFFYDYLTSVEHTEQPQNLDQNDRQLSTSFNILWFIKVVFYIAKINSFFYFNLKKNSYKVKHFDFILTFYSSNWTIYNEEFQIPVHDLLFLTDAIIIIKEQNENSKIWKPIWEPETKYLFILATSKWSNNLSV